MRTGRTLADCPPTRITTVFQGDGRLTADRPMVPETDPHLLNWTVSSRVSIPNVNANGARPLPPYGSHARGTTPNRGYLHGKC
ncbi:protein of unknown function [Methanoculleus bourgensis]|uniref:Uncharacterized protein n=1 Tax=Methanoculleus bourgensis TaxID=83986 RepID=A0A0X8XYC9_9EURY|nr:protein of unknown function [Methanoculleus bourgensis]